MIDKIGMLQSPQTQLQSNKNMAPANGDAFANYLKDALSQVNEDQLSADMFNKALATGDVQDLHQVMIASQQSLLSLQLTVQIRNKVVEAYQEIMRMPL